MSSVYISDLVGVIGVVICLLCHALTLKRKIKPHQWTFIVMNIVASSCIIYSLTYNFNLAAFLLESIWLLLALFSLFKLALRR